MNIPKTYTEGVWYDPNFGGFCEIRNTGEDIVLVTDREPKDVYYSFARDGITDPEEIKENLRVCTRVPQEAVDDPKEFIQNTLESFAGGEFTQRTASRKEEIGVEYARYHIAITE
jgi:hypothetical protein